MNEAAELDPLGFHRLLHAVLRANETPEEVSRANGVLLWVSKNIHTIREVLEPSQARLFNVVFQHFVKHKLPTNRTYAEEMARTEDRPDGMVALLEDYDQTLPLLTTPTTAIDMPQLMADRVADWERVAMLDTLKEAQRITVGIAAPKNKDDKRLKGAKDAIRYLMDKAHSGEIVGGVASTSYTEREAYTVMEGYAREQRDHANGHLEIATGLTCVEEVLGNFRRGEMVGILATNGSFKTTLCRTFVYNALLKGANCLHIPLESNADEELRCYMILHAHNERFDKVLRDRSNINRKSMRDLRLTAAECDFMEKCVEPDFMSNLPGHLTVTDLQTGIWENIKECIEAEGMKRPVDLVLIDYLALTDVTDSRNPIAATTEVIKQCKRLSRQYQGGRGVCILTPVQGNREGLERAEENEGRWDCSGVYMYSEFEKSVDKLLYTFADDALREAGALKIGSCKSRRSDDLGPTLVNLSRASGLITDFASMPQPRKNGEAKEEGWW